MDFEKYVKHERYSSDYLHEYHHKEVEKRFYQVLDKIGEPTGTCDAVFVTLRLKGKPDKIIAWNTANALEYKLCKHFWRRKGKKMLINNSTPFIASVEENLDTAKDHVHAIIVLKDLKQYYSHKELEKIIIETASNLKEINKKCPDAVKIRIFPFCDRTEKEARAVGNSIEYICKTSSKHNNPLERILLSKEQQENIKRQL